MLKKAHFSRHIVIFLCGMSPLVLNYAVGRYRDLKAQLRRPSLLWWATTHTGRSQASLLPAPLRRRLALDCMNSVGNPSEEADVPLVAVAAGRVGPGGC